VTTSLLCFDSGIMLLTLGFASARD